MKLLSKVPPLRSKQVCKGVVSRQCPAFRRPAFCHLSLARSLWLCLLPVPMNYLPPHYSSPDFTLNNLTLRKAQASHSTTCLLPSQIPQIPVPTGPAASFHHAMSASTASLVHSPWPTLPVHTFIPTTQNTPHASQLTEHFLSSPSFFPQ